jgi:hypothetical protein
MRTFLCPAAIILGLSVALVVQGARAEDTPEPPPPQVAAPAPPQVTAPAPLQVAAPAPARLQVAAPSVLERPQGMSEGASIALIATLVGLGAADVGFGIYDGVTAGRGRFPAVGASIAEALVTAPQVIVFDSGYAVVASDVRDDHNTEMAPLVLLPGVSNALFVHGTWSLLLPSSGHALIFPDPSPGVLYGVSWALGFDLAFTEPAIIGAFKQQLFPRALGGVEMALTAPQIAAASYGLAKDPHNTAGWAMIAGWSGGLFVHGLLSAAIPHVEPARPPPPPPPPKHPLLVPASIQVKPVPVTHGVALSVSGRLW